MTMPSMRKREKPIFDLISLSLVVLALLIFIFASIYLESAAYRAATVAVILMLSGLMLSIFLCGVQFDLRLTGREVVGTLEWTLVAMGAILIVNRVAPLVLDVAPVPENVFSVLMGVSEEVFIRVFLCSWFTLLAGRWIGIFASSLVWMVYHLAVYGSSLRALAIIFASGCILGYVYIQSRRASAVILPHVLINLIAGS